MINKQDSRKGIEQGRASFAYKKVCEAKKILKENDKKYKSYVKKIPMLIKTNGLGATLAFIKAKSKSNSNNDKKNNSNSADKKAYWLIYKHLTEWLKTSENSTLNLKDEDDLVNIVVSLESAEYRGVTNEVLAFINWMRRFAEGLIEGDENNG